MREYGPNGPNRPMIDDSLRRDHPMVDRGSGISSIGIMIAIAVALGVGLFAWTAMDNSRVADNTAPGVTTGSSTSTPGPSSPPPVKNQGESNSTR
jgi:hypothetical protein